MSFESHMLYKWSDGAAEGSACEAVMVDVPTTPGLTDIFIALARQFKIIIKS